MKKDSVVASFLAVMICTCIVGMIIYAAVDETSNPLEADVQYQREDYHLKEFIKAAPQALSKLSSALVGIRGINGLNWGHHFEKATITKNKEVSNYDSVRSFWTTQFTGPTTEGGYLLLGSRDPDSGVDMDLAEATSDCSGIIATVYGLKAKSAALILTDDELHGIELKFGFLVNPHREDKDKALLTITNLFEECFRVLGVEIINLNNIRFWDTGKFLYSLEIKAEQYEVIVKISIFDEYEAVENRGAVFYLDTMSYTYQMDSEIRKFNSENAVKMQYDFPIIEHLEIKDASQSIVPNMDQDRNGLRLWLGWKSAYLGAEGRSVLHNGELQKGVQQPGDFPY